MVNLDEQAITPACRRGLAYLRHQTFIADFYLAGGTALALQIGHRISIDPVRWADVRAYCQAAARRLARRLSGLD